MDHKYTYFPNDEHLKYRVIINVREDFLKRGKNTYIYEDVLAVSYNDAALILWWETGTIYIRMKWLYSFEINTIKEE